VQGEEEQRRAQAEEEEEKPVIINNYDNYNYKEGKDVLNVKQETRK
jgi:hypothetical protein